MEQTLPPRKAAAIPAAALAIILPALGLTACASGSPLPDAPSAATVTPSRAATLRSSGYDAPDVALADGETRAVSGARLVPASYRTPAAPQAASAQTQTAADETMSPYFTPEATPAPASTDETPAVPAPPRQAYAAPARAPLPDLDSIVVTRADAPRRPAQVYEGETRSVMPERTAPTRPAEAPRPAPVSAPAPVAAAPRPALARSATSGQAALHLASYRQRDQAQAGWAVLTRDHRAILAGLDPATTEVDLPGRGAFIRLIAGPLDPGSARTACAALETAGAYCAVTEWAAP